MEITAILNTHGQRETTLDTAISIKHYMTDQILLVVDEAGWSYFDDIKSISVLKGFYHNFDRNPYRNIILGLKMAASMWPKTDWFCYLEYDCLVGSSVFKKDLDIAEKQNVWLAGNDYRTEEENKVSLIFVEKMFNMKFSQIDYLLGACLFYHADFIKKCLEEDFFEKLLSYTNDFKDGFVPGYEGPAAWDFVEHLMPTLATHWGGKVKQFAKWDQKARHWKGNFQRYPMRWQPDLFDVEHEYLNAAMMHPVKKYDHPIREFHRDKRNVRI